MNYDSKEHLHRYAVWTAARAQRAFLKNEKINEVIEKTHLKREVFGLDQNMSASDFDAWHIVITDRLILELNKFKSYDIRYGQAAKVLNIYLKTTLVIPNCHINSPMINAIHPPIDNILLNNLRRKKYISSDLCVAWTKMGKDKYFEIIACLRKEFSSLWQSEVCWKSSDEKEII